MGSGRIEAIVFDFDGLLMDTETTMFESWRYEWRQHGLELDAATFFADHGGDVTDERYRQLAAAVGPGFDYQASHARRTAYREKLNRQLGLRDGAEAWLAQARAAGLRCAVASSSPDQWVTGLLDAFTVLAFGNEVSAHKPAPDVYLLALSRLGLAPAQAVAVEDTPHGVAAAKAAGLACIAIPNPFADPSRFTAPDLLLHSAADLTLHAALDAILEGTRHRRDRTIRTGQLGSDDCESGPRREEVPPASLDHQAEYWNSTGAGKSFTHPLDPAWLSPLHADARILDHGCGYGRLVAELHQRGFEHVEGADPSTALIARARTLCPGLRFTVIDSPPALPHPDATFDAALLFAVLTCIPSDSGQRQLIAELHRLLRPGGLIYLSDMCIQHDQRNQTRYEAFAAKYDVYGVFETGDGAVCRHHQPDWLRGLLTGFEYIADQKIHVQTMNGHPAKISQILARKLPT